MINKETARSEYTVQSGVVQYPIGFDFHFNGDDTPQIRVTIGAMIAEENVHFVISEDLLSIKLIPLEEEAPEDPNDVSWLDKWVGMSLVIERDIPFVQESDYQVGRISPERIEKDFDLSVMRDQMLAGQIKEHADDVQGEIDALHSRIDFVQEEHVLDMATVDRAMATKATKAELENAKTVLGEGIQGNADAILKTRNDYEAADQNIRSYMNKKDSELETTLNSHTGELATLRNQVSVVEEKIPESVSDTNPLVTKDDLADIDLDGYVKKSGDTMTGDLSFDVVDDKYKNIIWNPESEVWVEESGVKTRKYTVGPDISGTDFRIIQQYPTYKNASVVSGGVAVGADRFYPANSDGVMKLGLPNRRWDNVYTTNINNGKDLIVPKEGGTLARLEDVATKQDQLTAGDNIIISNNVISATGAGGGTGFDVQVVQELPATGQKGIIYLLAKDGAAPDVYDEYVWITATQTFELIGTTQVDLSGYAKKTYVDSADQTLRNNQESLYRNQIELRDQLNTKDADGNWTTLTTTAQAAIPAINELNDSKASKEELSGYLPLSGGTLTGALSFGGEGSRSFAFRTKGKSLAFEGAYDGEPYTARWLFEHNRIRCDNDSGYDTNFFIGSSDAPLFELWTKHIGTKGGLKITVPTEGGTLARVEDINAIGGDGTAGQVLTKTEDGMAWQDATGGGASLPDMTNNAGKFLMTDGTTASWGASYAKSDYVSWADATYHKINIGTADAYVGGASATAAYVAIGAKNCGAGCVAILGSAQYSSSVAIGNSAIAEYGSTAVGNNAQARGSSTTQGTIAVGYGAKTGYAKCAIQLGGNGALAGYTNSDANTFKVGNANGNFEMMDADGNVPLDRLTYVTNQIGDISTALTAILGE